MWGFLAHAAIFIFFVQPPDSHHALLKRAAFSSSSSSSFLPHPPTSFCLSTAGLVNTFCWLLVPLFLLRKPHLSHLDHGQSHKQETCSNHMTQSARLHFVFPATCPTPSVSPSHVWGCYWLFWLVFSFPASYPACWALSFHVLLVLRLMDSLQ